MKTDKNLSELVNEVLVSRDSAKRKAEALVKLGVTPYEAMVLAKTSMVVRPSRTRKTFSYTFGVEMETINCIRKNFLNIARAKGLDVLDHMSQYAGCHEDIAQYKIVPDGSLSGENTAECVTPALKGGNEGFKSLKACCEALNECGAGVNKSCGLHVHIGAAHLTEEQYCNVFYNYQRLENVIDTFMAESRRVNNSRWCASLRYHDLQSCETRQDVGMALNANRYHKVNPCSYARHKTIEFRQHQGTTNFTKIKNWVVFCAKLVEFSKENRIDDNIKGIEDIPFLNATEKRYFKSRKNALNS